MDAAVALALTMKYELGTSIKNNKKYIGQIERFSIEKLDCDLMRLSHLSKLYSGFLNEKTWNLNRVKEK